MNLICFVLNAICAAIYAYLAATRDDNGWYVIAALCWLVAASFWLSSVLAKKAPR